MSLRESFALFAIAACYSARPFPGAPCASNGACPSGQLCAPNGKCELPGDFDAAIDTPLEAAIDAPADAAIDAWDNGSCSARSSYAPPDFGSNQVAYNDYPGTSTHDERWTGNLTDGTLPDQLDLELYRNDGVFSGEDIKTGTYEIGASSDDLTYSYCGLCGFVSTQVNALTGPKDSYYWNAGTVTLTSVSGTLTGSVQNLVFRQVDFGSDGTETDDPSGCMTRIGSASFSATLQPGDSFVGTTSLGTPIRIGVHR